MPNKVKINFQGREVWAELVSIQQSQETWNQYLLADGSIVKSKTVVADIYRMVDIYDSEGNPVYYVKSTNIIHVNAPNELRKKS